MSRSFQPRRVSRWWLLLLLITAMACTLLHPAPVRWRVAGVLERAAAKRGLSVSYGEIDGTIFDVITIRNLRLRDISRADDGTDLFIASVEFAPSLSLPIFQRRDAIIDSVVLDGIRGQYAFRPQGSPPASPEPIAPVRPDPAPTPAARAVSRWLPERFILQRASLRVVRGNLSFRIAGLRVFGDPGTRGFCAARETEFAAASRSVTLPAWHGTNIWQRPQLSLYGIGLGNGVKLVSAGFDLSALPDSRIDGEVALDALGGSIRGQITADFSSSRNFFDVAGSLQRVAVDPVARLLGGSGPFAGSFDQGQFTFRGDPGDPASASASLRVEAREFQWQQRRFESLVAGATLVNRRVTVQQFELRQSKNLLKLSGESALPKFAASAAADGLISRAMAFLQAGFTCTIDARLEDLKALGQLADPNFSDLSGRMSLFGRIDGRAEGLDGYLNIEASSVQARGVPINSLTSTIRFQNEELHVTDLQVTSGKSDYFTGTGTWQPLGAGRYNAELKAQVADLALYAPVYVGALIPGPLAGALRLEWSGDGTRKSHSGAFKGAVEKFSAKRANARGTFARPTDLQVEGTYSPTSLSLRQLVLREGKREVLKADGSVPWLQDHRAWSQGQFLDPSLPISLRLEGSDAPLDLVAYFFSDAKSTDGRATGRVEITGTRSAPRVSGSLKLKGGTVEWAGPAPALNGVDGEFAFDAATLRVSAGNGEVLGAPFQFSGSINWDSDASAAVLDLALKAPEISWLDDQTMNADAAIDCHVEGPIDALAVSGTVTMVEGAKFWRRLVAVESAQVGDSLPLRAAMLLPPNVFGPQGWMGDRKIDLRVTAAKPLLIEAEGFSGEFVPDVRFGGTGRAPLVTQGELRLVKTAFTIDRSSSERWNVDSAVFSFSGGSAFDADPSVALLASRKIGRSKQVLKLSGNADAASGIDEAPVSVRLR